MPRVKCVRDYKWDCTRWATGEYPLLAVGVFHAGNSYDMPEELIEFFKSRGVVEGGSEPPDTSGSEHQLEVN